MYMTLTPRQRRRALRKKRNREKDEAYKKKAWEDGKLILENHNNRAFSPKYTIDLGQRLWEYFNKPWGSLEELTWELRKYKSRIQEWLILYSGDVPKDHIYQYFKTLLECYWDEPDKLLDYDRYWKANQDSTR